MQYGNNRSYLLDRSEAVATAANSILSGLTATTEVLLDSAAGILPGQPITGTHVPASTSATPNVPDNLIELSAALTGAVTQGQTFALTAPLASIATTGTTANGGSLVVVGSSANLYVGQSVTSGTLTAADTYIKAINGGTLTISPVAAGAIAAATTLTLGTAASLVTTADSINNGTIATITAAGTAVVGVLAGQSVTGTNVPADAAIDSVNYNSGSVVLISPDEFTGTIASGTTLTLGIASHVTASAASEVFGTNVQTAVNSAFAINPTQSRLEIRQTSPRGSNMNMGNLQTYANTLAANMAQAGDTTVTVESASAVGNELLITLLADI